MKQCSKDVEIVLDDGTVVEATLKVSEFVDEFNDTEKVQSVPGDWHAKHDEELTEDQQYEFDEKIEEIVFEEKWDWESAHEADDEDEEEEEE